MSTFFTICMLVAMAAVLGILILGIVTLARGGEFKEKYSNKLMQARVILQGVALAMFALAYLSSKS